MAESAGYLVRGVIRGTRSEPHPGQYLGAGKIEEVAAWLAEHPAVGVLLVNHELTPAQERNLERALGVRVQTRTGLILGVFASRAATHEGKLQVELAQLQHAATRLVRGWTHLDRQKGAVNLRGAGESQLEIDQRLLAVRIARIRDRLERVRRRRNESRKRRQRNRVPTAVLVGYTNAGKSTLFNRLTCAEVLAADQLFATLDPTQRRIVAPGVGTVMLIDTVGFIRDLPHALIDAFRATLEEVASADLLIHVLDGAAPDARARKAEVEAVLEEIGASATPCLEVVNKSDLCSSGLAARRLAVSAKTGQGVDALLDAIAERLAGVLTEQRIVLDPACGRLRAELYARDAVIGEAVSDCGEMTLTVRMGADEFARITAEPGVTTL